MSKQELRANAVFIGVPLLLLALLIWFAPWRDWVVKPQEVMKEVKACVICNKPITFYYGSQQPVTDSKFVVMLLEVNDNYTSTGNGRYAHIDCYDKWWAKVRVK